MELKKGLNVTSSNFYYDLVDGGYLNPREICADEEDAEKVNAAITIIEDFKKSCEAQIEDFIQ